MQVCPFPSFFVLEELEMSTGDLVSRNVVLFPGGGVREAAIKQSQALVPLGTEFVLGPENLPHLSVYQAAYPPEGVERLAAAVQAFAARTSSFEVSMGGFGIFWGTFVFWDAVKRDMLAALHQRLLEALNPLRGGTLLPIHQQILDDPSVPEVFRNSIRTYGNPLCGEQERPHITLTRLKSPDHAGPALQVLSVLAQGADVTFRVSSLYLTEVGPHGTCPRVLQEFPFGWTDGCRDVSLQGA